MDLGTKDKPRPLNWAKEMANDEKKAMIELLKNFRYVFAWSYEDMQGVGSLAISASNSSLNTDANR